MKINKIEIQNYRSFEDMTIYPGNIMALVGRNNSGKSNILKALELFFESSTKLVDKECYHHNQTSREIIITVTFTGLNAWEISQLSPWMYDEQLIVRRKIICKEEESSYEISTVAITKVPQQEWLQTDKINGENISQWWDNKGELKIGSIDFAKQLGSTKPRVGDWKNVAIAFINANKPDINWIVVERENPAGYANVLKGTLPEYIFIPAVRDVTEEAKVTKTNPFGKLINSLLGKTTTLQKSLLDDKLGEIEKLLNRSESDDRISEIRNLECSLTKYISDIMECDVEIEMRLPRLQEIFGEAKIYADDGIRTTIETKGNGMQRSMIFSILRTYVDLTRQQEFSEGEKQRTTIFAIEEPELYLHPQSQRTLMSVLNQIGSGNDQVFYSTQSNLFVDIRYFDNICILRREKKNDRYCSCSMQLFMSDLVDDLKARKGIDGTAEIFRELYAHVFNPLINEGFFADKVVLVEGPSEQYSLPIYADIMGHENYNFDRHNISVIHSEGKGQMDRLLRIFNGFKIPTYCWFDGDKTNDDSEIKNKTLELLELLGDPVADINDIQTKVTNKYAVMGKKFEDTLREELADYENIVSQATKEIVPATKPLIHRYIANTLKKRVDEGEQPENVLPASIIRIVKAIKDVSYSGTILRKTE